MSKLQTIIKKDILDSLKNWETLYSLIGIPIASFFIIIQMLNRKMNAPILFPTHYSNFYKNIEGLYTVYGLNHFEPQIAFTMLQFNTVYFFIIALISCVMPFVLSATSLTTEKEQDTLETLFALPFTTKEILTSKIIASVVLPFLGSLMCYPFVIAAVYLKYDAAIAYYLLGIKWWLLHLIIVPIYALVTASGGICISLKVKTSRAAIFIAALFYIPFMGIIIPLMYGTLLFNFQFILFSIIAGSIMFVILFLLAFHLFDREKMLLRYR